MIKKNWRGVERLDVKQSITVVACPTRVNHCHLTTVEAILKQSVYQ